MAPPPNETQQERDRQCSSARKNFPPDAERHWPERQTTNKNLAISVPCAAHCLSRFSCRFRTFFVPGKAKQGKQVIQELYGK